MPRRSDEFLDLVPRLCERLEYLLCFFGADRSDREKRPLRNTSPYYRWLAYTLVRRELFEEGRAFGHAPDVALEILINAWEGLKTWGIDPMVREGIMHECLSWLASLKAQVVTMQPFLLAPVHEGIPALSAVSVPAGEKVHFRGDFIVLWSERGIARTAVVDVKSDFGAVFTDKFLRKSARRYADMGIPFFIACPSVLLSDFGTMRKKKYLLDMDPWWEHRQYPMEYRLGPYPKPESVPWLRQIV